MKGINYKTRSKDVRKISVMWIWQRFPKYNKRVKAIKEKHNKLGFIKISKSA